MSAGAGPAALATISPAVSLNEKRLRGALDRQRRRWCRDNAPAGNAAQF